MQSTRKHLHYDDTSSQFYEPPHCSYLQSTLYDRYSQALSNLYIKSITMDSHVNGDLTLHFGFRTHLHYPFIEELIKVLPLKETYFTYQVIRINFNLHRQTNKEIENLFKQVFQQIKKRGITSDTEKYFLDGLNQYLDDFQSGFLEGNLYERKGYPCQKPKRDRLANTFFDRKAEELYQAIIHAQKDKVSYLLKRGYDSNAIHNQHTDNKCTMLTAAAIIGPGVGKNFAELIGIIALLIQYGADTNQRVSEFIQYGACTLGNTTEEMVADKCLQKGVNLSFFFEVIRLLKASKKSRPHIPAHHPNCQSAIAKLIRQADDFLVDKKARNSTIYGIAGFQAEKISIQHIKARDGKEIIVTTKSYAQLSWHEQKCMYLLFRKFYPYQTRVEENEWPEYFYNNFIKVDKKQTFFDLLWMDGKMVGFNIAEIDKKCIAGKDIIYHRIKLALATPVLRNYARLMSLISFQRGFILQEEQPQVRVITGFENASENAYLQVKELDFFPKYLHDFLIILKEFYPHEELYKINDQYYIQDELAYSISHHPQSFWMTPAELDIEIHNEHVRLPGKSEVIAFDNNEKNKNRFSSVINPRLNNTTFAGWIEAQVNRDAKVKYSLENRL